MTLIRNQGELGKLAAVYSRHQCQLLQSPDRVAPCSIQILSGKEARTGLLVGLAIGQHVPCCGRGTALSRGHRFGPTPTHHQLQVSDNKICTYVYVAVKIPKTMIQ